MRRQGPSAASVTHLLSAPDIPSFCTQNLGLGEAGKYISLRAADVPHDNDDLFRYYIYHCSTTITYQPVPG